MPNEKDKQKRGFGDPLTSRERSQQILFSPFGRFAKKRKQKRGRERRARLGYT
jgi:hypothetical protein